MTTKAKANRYRIRRRDVADSLALPEGRVTAPNADAELRADHAMQDAMRAASAPKAEKPVAAPDTPTKPTMKAAVEKAAAAKSKPARRSRARGKSSAPPPDSDAAILAEGLTGRQLRIARRVANRHGLEPASDIEAVRMLRKKGVDPFTRETILDLVTDTSRKNLPQTIPQQQVASPQVNTEADIAREVRQIQQDIARRRRLKMALLVARLAFFVLLPTALAGYYFFRMATPMFATHSEFVIQQAESQSGTAGLGGMFSGAVGAATQDAVAVQSYLTSRAAMLRLDEDLGFRAHFASPEIDALQRLDRDASYEDAYDIYQKRVKISFDPTEGIVRMEVIAADPETSRAFSMALLSYAEDQVDQLTQRLREDQMRGARESFEEAEDMVRAAQTRVLDLQQARGVLSADLEVSSLMSQISALEVELNTERLRLAELQENAQPNQTRVSILEGNIARLSRLIEDLRGQMTDGGTSGGSLALISGELVIAQADLETRQLMLSQALQQLETARIEANRQVRYLSTSVSPIAPDEASYPRAFENTFLAFLVFAGLYLMISLTASILREQVSS